jgi:DNA-binding NarL/FixJ family response regulator
MMRILLADDHDLVRDSLSLLLQGLDPEVEVVHAATLPEALKKAGAGVFDLVLLDINMPGMNRVAGVETMRGALPDVPIVVVSGQITPDTVMDALKAGAAGFIPKTMAGKAMLNAIRLVMSGERYIPRLVLEGAASPSGDSTGSAGEGGPAALSRREREVLGLLASGLSNKEIARRLQVETVTVAVHLSSVYRKLGAANRTQAVRIALEQGLHLS